MDQNRQEDKKNLINEGKEKVSAEVDKGKNIKHNVMNIKISKIFCTLILYFGNFQRPTHSPSSYTMSSFYLL